MDKFQPIWLWSEDMEVIVCLPTDAIEAYVPGLAITTPGFLEPGDSGRNLYVILDGVRGELLMNISEYLRCFFPKASASTTASGASTSDALDGKEARMQLTKDFVQNLNTNMIEMMLAEVAKRNSTAVEMVLLHSVLQKEANNRKFSRWKHDLGKKPMIPNMK